MSSQKLLSKLFCSTFISLIKRISSEKKIITTLQKGGLLWGYKPPILASVSRRWLSLCSSHTGFVAFATSQEVFLSL
ncbi:hypothetical protein, partial [Tetragenococcus halophilus]|uniref:hypothetical protein n=1 Tax=Tetragenococcus halophilus TaxID=51669 RepID=UPI00295E62ED